MKRFLLTSIFALMIMCISAQSLVSRIKLYANHEELMALADRGLSIDHGEYKAGVYVICELSQEELAIAEEAGVEYEILIPDVTRFYRERNEPFLSKLDEIKRMEYSLSREWPVPEGFELGTCGGFLTVDQCMEHLDSMAAQYPDLISPRNALDYTTHNGRELYWVRLSDNPASDEDETEVLYTGMHHAREPIGMQLLIYYMYYLLENYETDPDVQYIVDNFELYFLPILNPDGYAYNIQNQPGGGGNWRKNRRQNEDGSHGVDINRNYGFMWGYNNSGSSPEPSDDTYRGPSPFSEPETQCIRDFCNERQFRIALNYHSYSNYLLYPWGWSADPCPDDFVFSFHGEIMTRENGYLYGPGYTTIYPTNGGSDDWMYGEQDTKGLIYSYTPEVGDGNAGFWPPISLIIPLCQENMYQNIMAALLSGPYALVSDISPTIIEDKNGLLFFEMQRLGLQDSATYTVSIEPLNDAIAAVSEPVVFDNLEISETVSAAFTYTLKEDIYSGESIEYLLSVNDGLATLSDTIRKVYGTAVVVFQDSASGIANWNSPKWNITVSQYHTPFTSMADSPVGQYANYETNILTLKDSIDLTEIAYANLEFWAKWDIESGYDYVQVFVSQDDGVNWIPLEGKYTHPGNLSQAYNEPLYDGQQEEWVKEEISLEPYIGEQIKLRFTLVSDTYVVGDGYFWDDMTVTIVDLATGVGDEETQHVASLDPNPVATFVPNPASGIVTVLYNTEKTGDGMKSLKLFDLRGIQVYESTFNGVEGSLKLDVDSWPDGMYFYAIFQSGSIIDNGKLVVR